METTGRLLEESVWMATEQIPLRHPLDRDIHCEDVVVGAGIAGLLTAYHLARAGRTVVLLDDGPIAGGQTQLTTAHLSNAIDDRYQEMVRLHGRDGARLAAESHTAAIDRLEAIARDEQIDCDFERLDGYLFNPPREPVESLEQEFAAARETGIVKVDWVERAPIPALQTGPCLRFHQQGQFHPLKFLKGLSSAFERLGGTIYTTTHASKVSGGAMAVVETDRGHTVTAANVVVATNSPVNDMFAIHTKQAPYTTYVVGLRVPAGSIEHALYWDTLDPYHYVRLQAAADGFSDHGAEILIVGGEDHKTGHADDGGERHARLEAWARERFPMATELEFRWAGQVMETVDGLGFIGRNPGDAENVYIATGDSGMGMTHGAIAGMLISDLILGRRNGWAALYDPARKRAGALWEYARENVDVAAQYAAWITPGEISSPEEVAPGQGAIMRKGLRKVAVYCDMGGVRTELSATCPHLGCIVAWNSTEKTWDCPCHGSRFAPRGDVLNGPANVGLEPV